MSGSNDLGFQFLKMYIIGGGCCLVAVGAAIGAIIVEWLR